MEEFFKLLSVDRDKPGSPFEVMISEYDYVSYYLKVYFKPNSNCNLYTFIGSHGQPTAYYTIVIITGTQLQKKEYLPCLQCRISENYHFTNTGAINTEMSDEVLLPLLQY